jgi:hypothetical protein
MLVKQKLKPVSCLGGPRRSERTAIALENEFDRVKSQEKSHSDYKAGDGDASED